MTKGRALKMSAGAKVPAARFLRVWLVVAVWCLAWPAFCGGERAYIDITRPNFEKLPIAIPDFKWQNRREKDLGREMVGTLRKDIEISGFFRQVDPALFPGDAETIGVTEKEVRFDRWKKIDVEFLIRALYEVKDGSLRLEARLFDVVNGKRILGKVFEGRAGDGRAMIHRFVDEVLLTLTGKRGIFETKIAFVQVEGNVKEIHVVDFDGENPVPITRDGSISLSPAWSPDGARMAYVSYLEGSPKIFVLDLLKGSRRLLSGYKGLNIAPAWRPGASELAATLSRKGNPDIYLLTDSGSVRRRLAGSWAIEVSPSWSPDGRRLAYVSGESGSPQIYVLEVEGGEERRITFEGEYNTSPAWSPGGDWIAYSGLTGGSHEIFLIRPDGTDKRRVTRGGGSNESPTWSPDGRMLAFSSTRGGRSAVWITNLDGTESRRLTKMAGSQRLPDWSPYFTDR